MKKAFFSICTFAAISAFAQDVDLKKGKILVDGKQWGTYEGCKMFAPDCTFSIGEEEIEIQTKSIKDPAEVSRSNTSGSVNWGEVKFLGKKKSFEIQGSSSTIAKALYKSNVVGANGKFNDEGIDRIIEKYGTEFSDKYYSRPASQTIIIEDSRPRTGVNISIGR